MPSLSEYFVVNETYIIGTPQEKFRDSGSNELIYVVVVISFYAAALMILIGSQIRRTQREGEEAEYYDEYLSKRRYMMRKRKKDKLSVLSNLMKPRDPIIEQQIPEEVI